MMIRTVRLGDIVETTTGGTPARGNKSFYDGNIPWIKSGELPDGDITEVEERISDEGLKNSNARVLDTGSLLIAMYGATVGRLGVLTFPAATNQAVCAITPSKDIDRDYLFYWLLSSRSELLKASFGGAQPNISQTLIRDLEIPLPSFKEQRQIASQLKANLAEVEKARKATKIQISETESLANAIIYDSIKTGNSSTKSLGDVLDEVKKGIGKTWQEYLVLGATRNGLALAKEPPGKKPERYKPIFPGTVFYNPMRILIGSIAFVDEDDTPGITSPDYVALKGKAGVVDSRWFYYWLRSQYGKTCINSLARGAVRERMLFNRLADGKIELPEFKTQQKVSEALKEIKTIRINFERRLKELELLPNKLLIETFEKIASN
jgi:type I restriction enzyme, S subunit